MANDKAQAQYRRPQRERIGQSAKTLYALEDRAAEAFKEAAEERGRIGGLRDFYCEALPQAIYDWLDRWDLEAGRLAAEQWLMDEFGAVVTYPRKEGGGK